MRTQLLLALAFLCGAEVVHAQQWPGYSYNPPYAGYAPYSPPLAQPLMLSAVDPVVAPEGAGQVSPASSVSGGGKRTEGKPWWISAAATLSWFRPDRLPTPLITAGSLDAARPGALGQPGTSVLFGQTLSYDQVFGAQAEVGCFFLDDDTWSAELRGFYMFPERVRFTAASDETGRPLIARPILNVVARQEASLLTSFPDTVVGSTAIDAGSELYGFEVNARAHGYPRNGLHVDGLAGFRFLHLREHLTIVDRLRGLQDNALSFLQTPVNKPNTLEDMDSFRATNHFYGGQLGARLGWEDERASLSLFAKVAIGLTTERAEINGTTTLVTPNGNNQVAPGGILALPTNIGLRNRTVFGIVPEWGTTFTVTVTDYCRLTGGYSFLLWNRVFRPGDLIDRGINPTQIPSAGSGQVTDPLRPEFRLNDSPFWAHTLNAGVEFLF